MKLEIVPLDLREANELVARWHRHHQPTLSHKFSIGVANEAGEIVGAVICGRPVSRNADNGWTLEAYRVVTDGTKNACSALYAAAWRTARSMGYKRLVTYTLIEEPGTSLRAAGWKCIGTTAGGSWSRGDRPRVDKHPLGQKLIWEVA